MTKKKSQPFLKSLLGFYHEQLIVNFILLKESQIPLPFCTNKVIQCSRAFSRCQYWVITSVCRHVLARLPKWNLILGLLWKSVQILQILLKSAKIPGNLLEDLNKFYCYWRKYIAIQEISPNEMVWACQDSRVVSPLHELVIILGYTYITCIAEYYARQWNGRKKNQYLIC